MAWWVVGTASAPPPAPGRREQNPAASQPVGHSAPRGRGGGGAASPQTPERGLLQPASPASRNSARFP